jgi:phenylpropionate dioxygenase-like ring-hydroxylating dioxygenase large terminal subunit
MGDRDQADPALIPEAYDLDDPRYLMRTGHMDYKANYQLLNDNLTDFSHVSYVHANSFGVTEYWARVRPVVKPIERGIRVSRWVNLAAEAVSADAPTKSLSTGGSFPTAIYQSYDFLAPGILNMYTAVHRPDDIPADGVSRSEADPIMANVTSQAVTPMTEGSTRYFFSWGPRVQDGGVGEADAMLEVAKKAFAEDLEVIEAQQAVIDLCGPGREMLTTADVGPVQMRAVMRKLMRAEQPEGADEGNDARLDGAPA